MEGDIAIFTQGERGVRDLEKQSKHQNEQIWSDIFMLDICYLLTVIEQLA